MCSDRLIVHKLQSRKENDASNEGPLTATTLKLFIHISEHQPISRGIGIWDIMWEGVNVNKF